MAANPGRRKRTAPACTGPISVKDGDAIVVDMANLAKAAAGGSGSSPGAHSTFSSAASPGVVSLFFANEYYATDEEYVFAIAEAMRPEYEAIAAAGAALQLDCPDLAMGRHSAYASMELPEFRRRLALNIEALNHAVRNIPAEQLRMHLCWGNYPGPHHRDVELAEIIDLVWTAKPRTVLFEAANPRHAHEWTLFEDTRVPDDKVLCPGVIEPQSNYIEHPELVAQRIERYAAPRRSRPGHGRRRLRVQRPRRHAGHRPRRRLGQARRSGRGRRYRVGPPLALARAPGSLQCAGEVALEGGGHGGDELGGRC